MLKIVDVDYNVVGSLDNHEGSVEKYQDNEVLIPMDEEAVKESLVFTTEIMVTRPIILPIVIRRFNCNQL